MLHEATRLVDAMYNFCIESYILLSFGKYSYVQSYKLKMALLDTFGAVFISFQWKLISDLGSGTK